MFSSATAAPRTQNLFTRAVERARRTGRTLLDLTESNPTATGITVSTSVLQALAATANLNYAPAPFGLAGARAHVASTYPAAQRPGIDRVMLTSSTSEAYSYCFKVLCDPGDRVLVPEPGYPLLEELARLEHVRLARYRVQYDGSWHIDLDSLRWAARGGARAVVAVSPNNPTGNRLTDEELQVIASLRIPLIADEVFAAYPLEGRQRVAETALRCEDTLIMALGGLSKYCALPQLKLSWTVLGGPALWVAEAGRRLEHVADTFLSVAAPVQHALGDLLEAGAGVRQRLLRRCLTNLAHLKHRLTDSSATVLFAEAGWYAVVRLPSTRTEEAWVQTLLEEHDVLVHPGYFYDFQQAPLIVLSLIVPERQFDEAAVRLARACHDA